MNDAAAAPRSNLGLRLLTAGFFGPIIVYSLYWGPTWLFPAIAATFCTLGSYELFTIVAPQHPLLRAWGVAATVATYGAVGLGWGAAQLPVGLMTLACGGLLTVLARPEPIETVAMRMGWALAGPIYLGVLFGAIALLFRQEHGGSWVMLALVCGFFSDTAGYFVGRKFGKRKLAPLVSPKKTIEGAIGGVCGGLFGGLLAHVWFLRELTFAHAMFVSLIATIAGQLGDLCESLLKRGVNVKDSGTLLPGHGGVLDRSDAMLFSAAVIWAYLAAMHAL
jgi:phosphatidate cytidylyltransferase